MNAAFSALAAVCGHGILPPLAQSGVLVGLLVAGAAGSVAHCGPMCGPFVLGQAAARLAAVPAASLCERHRLQAGALLPYHLGRIVSYAALGALAAGIGAALGFIPWLARVGGVALLLAALLFADQALRRAYRRPGRRFAAAALRLPGAIAGVLRGNGRLRQGAARQFALGAALGFLPCGFLYAALAVAAGSGAAWRGAAAMGAFGLGTTPVLVMLGIAGGIGLPAWQGLMRAVGPAILAGNAVLLLTLGLARLFA